jgi:chromosome segregation ATPase
MSELYEELLRTQQARLDEKDHYVHEIQEKEQRIQDLTQRVHAHESELKMLPAAPKDLITRYARQEVTMQMVTRLLEELKRTGAFRRKKREELVEEIQTLLESY